MYSTITLDDIGQDVNLKTMSYLDAIQNRNLGLTSKYHYHKFRSKKHLLNISKISLNEYGRYRSDGANKVDILGSLKHMRNLIKLDASFFNIHNQSDCTLLVESFPYLRHLRVLDLSRNEILPNGGEIIAQNLRYLPNLVELNIYENEDLNEGCLAIAQHLHHLPKLRVLNIDETISVGTDYLFQEITKCFERWPKTLHSLHIGNNYRICPVSLAENIHHLSNLRKLSLRELSLTDLVIDNLDSLGHLIELDLTQSNLSLLIDSLIRYFRNNGRQLQILKVEFCELWPTQMKRFVEHLHLLPHLTKLNISGNHINDEICQIIIDQLDNIYDLKYLYMQANDEEIDRRTIIQLRQKSRDRQIQLFL